MDDFWLRVLVFVFLASLLYVAIMAFTDYLIGKDWL